MDGISPADRARARGITEVLHFTTSKGLVGILASRRLLSRDALAESEYLEDIRYYNSASRLRDAAWTRYVNLSVTRINGDMLGYSEKWHEVDGVWWAVLAFDVEILDHPEVLFSTTNNVYPVTKRNPDGDGFDALFAQDVPWGKFGDTRHRSSSMSPSLTTCPQAEVLYPDAIKLDYLRSIYVRDAVHAGLVQGLIAAVNIGPGVDLSTVKVQTNISVFA